jgi:hypothetical protein
MVKKRDTFTRGHDKLVLLVGAGSSCHLGLPTLNDLLARVILGEDDVANLIRETRNSIQSQSHRFKPAVFEELIVRIKYYLKIAETLRTDRTFLQSMGQIPNDVMNGALEWKWKQALTRCYRILLTEYGPKKINPLSKEFSVTIDILSTLAKTNGNQIHVYTTNYDCSFQVLAANCTKLSFMTHINPKNGKFTESWHCSNPSVISDSPKVYIHRLHGCIAWFNFTVDQSLNSGSTVKEIYGAGEDLEIDDDMLLDQMCIKLIATQLIGINPAFSSAFDEFSGHLRSIETLVVWGYSFHDLEVIRAINGVFNERDSALKILYLNPYITETAARATIEQTLIQAPTQPAIDLKPRRIDWTPNDGISAIVPAIVKSI